MAAKRTSSGARNPYQGDAFELAKYRKAREKWEREGRRGPPPPPPKRRNPKPSADLFEEIDFDANPHRKYSSAQIEHWNRIRSRQMKQGDPRRGTARVWSGRDNRFIPLEEWREPNMAKRARGKKNPHGHKHHVGCGCPLDAQRKMAAGHGACCDSCARAAARPQNPAERTLAKRVVSC